MPIPAGAENILYGTLIAHIAGSACLVVVFSIRKNERNKRFPILFGINAAVVVISALIGPIYLDLAKSLDVAAFLMYMIIAGYVVSIEIPGYILLSRFDGRVTAVLEEIRRKMVRLRYHFDEIDYLTALFTANKKNLESVAVSDIMDDFLERSRTIKNLDGTLYDITLREIVGQSRQVSERSKHPFPKLIEIMSLAGISFLIGQFLNYLLA